MNKLYILSALGIMLVLNSCTVIGGIFKAGAVVGVIAVVVPEVPAVKLLINRYSNIL